MYELKNMKATLNGCKQTISQSYIEDRNKLHELHESISGNYKLIGVVYKKKLKVVKQSKIFRYSNGYFKCLHCGDIFMESIGYMMRNGANRKICPLCRYRLIKDFIFSKCPWSVKESFHNKYRKYNSYINVKNKILRYCTRIRLLKIRPTKNGGRYRCLFKCNKCGTKFKRSIPGHIRTRNVRYINCPKCFHNISTGEEKVMSYLKRHKVHYKYGFITNIIYKGHLHFDFWLPRYHIAIEYDGRQHFVPIKHFGGKKQFGIEKKRDHLKDKYCHHHHIKLIRIAYYQSIHKVLDKKLNKQLSLF